MTQQVYHDFLKHKGINAKKRYGSYSTTIDAYFDDSVAKHLDLHDSYMRRTAKQTRQGG